MTSTDQLGARVRATLHAKAAAIDPFVGAFDPHRRVDLDLFELARIEQRRPAGARRRVAFGSAAAAVVLVAAAIGHVLANGGGKPTTVHTLESTVAPTTALQPAASILAPLVPGWVPAGFQLLSIESVPVPTSSKPDTASTLQLTYVDPSGGRGPGQSPRLLVMTGRSTAAGTSGPTFVAATNEVRSATADGRFAQVISPNWTMSEADLTRVATSVAPVDATRLASLRREADAAVTAYFPVMASATLDAATGGPVTVEVRGTGGNPNVVCVVVKGQRSCGTRYLLTVPSSPIDASLVVGGTWLVAAVAPATGVATGAAQMPVVHDGGPDGGALGARLPGAVHAHAGGWAMTLVAPTSSVASYTVGLGQHVAGGALRPAA